MESLDPTLWRGMLSQLRRDHASLCRQWFDQLKPLGFDGGVLTIQAATALHKQYLERECRKAFAEVAQTLTGALVTVRFVGPDAGYADPGQANGVDEIAITPDYSFETFVSGPNNRLAHAASVAVANNPGQAYNPLFIHGGVGLGKTHLLQAICQRILDQQPDTRLLYLSCDAFVNQFLECVQSGQMNQFRHRFRHVNLILIDDIHFLTGKEQTQEEFFHTFNVLYQAGQQIVLSSDSPPSEIPQLEERLVSRFQWGLVANVSRPTYETRMAILRTKAAMRDVTISDDLASFLASRIDSNVRELEGAITTLQGHAAAQERPIDLALGKEVFGDRDDTAAETQITLQDVIKAVTGFYNVRLSDLQSKRRHKSIAEPRQVCMWLARRYTRFSLQEIGGYFGGRDHTTVMHAIRAVEERRESEPDFAHALGRFEHALGGS